MKHLLAALVAVLVAFGLVACSDDGSTVRDGDSASSSGSASAPGSGSAVACDPVGDPAEADSTVDVELDEWSVAAPDTIDAGTVHFAAANVGEEAHELVVVRADSVADIPRDDNGDPDEEAIPEEDFIGEIEPFPAGETCDGVFGLDPGNYVLYCAIVEDHDGETVSHFQKGMNRTLTVE